jgi:uncharacterized protein (TIGR03545 family)
LSTDRPVSTDRERKKIPKIFRKPVTEQELQKKILGRIFINEDRSFVRSLYTKDEAGIYLIKEQLGQDEIKKLRALAKSIKANRGVVKTGRLIILAVLIAGILMFSLLFKNRLAEMAAEYGLESIFAAKADVTRLRLSLIQGRVSLDHLEVADREKPMRNLFELGRTEIAFNAVELLKGKIVAENIECQEIRWNTLRESSGRLPWDRRSDEGQSGTAEGMRQTTSSPLGLPSIDVSELIEQHLDKLKSRETVERINRELEGLIKDWSSTLEKTEKELSDLAGKVESTGRIDVGNIKSATEAQSALTQIGEVYPAAETLEKSISRINESITDEGERIDGVYRSVQDALNEDLQYLLSFAGSPESTVKSLVSSMASQYLKQALGDYYGYALRALGFTNNLKAEREKQPEQRPKRRSGVDVPFPARHYPKFLLKSLSVSVGSRTSREYTEGFLRNVSSNPDLTDQPVTFHLGQIQGKQTLSVQGLIDTRSKRDKTLELEFEAAGYPFSIQEGLDFLTLSGIRGSYSFASDFALDSHNEATGTAALTLRELEIELSRVNEPISAALVEILSKTPRVEIEILFRISQDRGVQLNASSNVDKLISERIGESIARLTSEYQEKIRGQLTGKIHSELEKNKTLYASFKELEKTSEGDLTDIQGYKKLLDKKKEELEARVSEIKREAEKKITKEVGKELDKAKEKIKLPF